MKDAAWGRLLAMMRDGMVVPVVGARLLRDADGGSLQARVAAKLLADYEIALPPGGLTPYRELNEAVSLLKGTADMQDLYGDIHLAMRDLRKQGLQVPAPMQQLAQISDFRLLVTLTPDDLLLQALQAEGRAVNEVVHSPKLPTSEGSDLPLDWQEKGGATQLLYLFGKARPTPLFAIHDEDVLEYAHNVIARGSHAPTAFLGALQDRNLLLIGCNFPDWLSRFILRAARKGRLADQKGGREWLVEPLRQEDPFIGFLGKYSPETAVLSNVDPVEFVAELHRRWMAEHLPGGSAVKPDDGEPPTPESAMFFVSYSRTTDLAPALALVARLRELGVADNEIWFDGQTLEPADRWRQRIHDGIRGCRYFLPVVSRAAATRPEAFVFREWEQATDRLPEMNRAFLLPLVVDAENHPETYNQASVQAWVTRGINFGHAPGGEPDGRAVDKLRQLVREARSRATT
ncbi:TIR domain-containing protein [Rubrivivax sp. A210]|uniref:toll/interleukin-1 receptor domain-containing protein n=1 Tax=Rubrivivax sp. A210 TaxID=2772301 RepID=UPI001918F7AC|nr:toll/interleukin-1 receptor domain-containing protein [Rubrivivax sp. A210]CAD5373487.1 TIR domain-containing protein [Rubrivivax sp. A210]